MRTLRIGLALTCFIAFNAYSQKTLLDLALAISVSKNPTRARQELMEKFKTTQYADAVTLSAIVTEYHHENDTPLYLEHSGTIYDAIEHFNETPGFAEKIYLLLHNAHDESMIRGHIYELETALALEEQGEPVKEFGYAITCPINNIDRSIDLRTKHRRLIECKAITWENYPLDNHRSDKIQTQLLSYQAFSERHKKSSFILHSKRPISPQWKQWLAYNDIEYKEEWIPES